MEIINFSVGLSSLNCYNGYTLYLHNEVSSAELLDPTFFEMKEYNDNCVNIFFPTLSAIDTPRVLCLGFRGCKFIISHRLCFASRRSF